MDGWFPVWSPRGWSLASGSVSLVIDGRTIPLVYEGQAIPCSGPKWITEDLLVFASSDRGTFRYQRSTGEVVHLGPEWSNYAAAGTGDWYAASGGSIRRNGFSIAPGYWPHVSPSGDLAILHEPDGRNEHRVLTVNGQHVLTGYIEQPQVLDGVVVWSQFVDGGRSRETWARISGINIRVAPTEGIEFDPRLVLTPEGIWLVVHDHTDWIVVPLGSAIGYRRRTGDNTNLHPAVKCEGSTIIIAACTGRGEPVLEAFDLASPRADVRAASSQLPTPNPQPAPAPAPTPDPTPMYQPVPSQIEVVELVWQRATPAQRAEPVWIANAVAWELRNRGLDYYVNQKRGTQGDSEDAVSTPHPDGAGGWAIIDVVGGFKAGQIGVGSPAWNDVTEKTINQGEVGGGRLPTNPWLAGDEDDPGDTDTPKPPPVFTWGRLRPVVEDLRDHAAALAARSDDLLGMADVLAAIPEPSAPAPPTCPPCELPHHPSAPAFPVASEPDLQARVTEWAAAFRHGTRRIMPPDLTAFLLYRFFVEGYSHEQLVETARERGQG